MKPTTILVALTPSLAAGAATIHLCGDSTMARSSDPQMQGWGEYLQYSFDKSKFLVRNAAIGGRSARSFTRENRFGEVAKLVKPGDWVVIEFGHNDGGSLSNDNGRSACGGEGSQTCQTTYNGVKETVQTYPTYLKNATSIFLKAGAKVIVSSPTPNNICETGTCSWGPYRFDYFSWLAASQSGGTKAGVYFVAHGHYSAQAMKNLGPAVVNAGYIKDHTHTAASIADRIMAKSFVLGLMCGSSQLGKEVKNATNEVINQGGLGGCIQFNSSVPTR